MLFFAPGLSLKYEKRKIPNYAIRFNVTAENERATQEIDKEGNWLQREVNRTWEIVMYNHVDNTEETSTQTDPPFIETRSITYY